MRVDSGDLGEMRVAVLGQGSIGRRHAANLLDLGCSVIAFDPLVQESPVGVERAASAEEALQRAAAAVVATPTANHLADARVVLESGCHALVEKPLAVSPDGVDELIELADARSLVLAVAMNLRFHPGPRTVKDLLDAGAVGRPLTSQFTFGYHLPSWRPGIDYTRSYSARSDLGGGVLLDVIHEFDYAAWVLGPITEVAGVVDKVSRLEIDVEDVALVNARFANGAVGSFNLDYLDHGYRRGCRIVGEDASLEWSWRSETVEILRGGGQVESRAAASAVDESYRLESAAFVAAVMGSLGAADSGLVSAQEATAALAVVEAVRRSAAEGGRATPVASAA